MSGSSTDPSGGALWERFESEKKAQERNAGVEALGPGKMRSKRYLEKNESTAGEKTSCVEKDGTHTH